MKNLIYIGLVIVGLGVWVPKAGANQGYSLNIAGTISPGHISELTAQGLSATDPLFSHQTNLSQIKVPDAWATTTGAQTVIAVIDTGIDYSQEDLQGKLWNNPREIAGNNIDDDGNGYVDDVNGYNVIDNNSNLTDGHGHGTGIASIIAASANNGKGIAGINWSGRIMVVKALNSTGGGDFQDVVDGIHYAVDNGAKIINMSFGSPEDVPLLKDAINYALSKDVLIVSAVGNTGGNSILYPAAYPGVLAIGSVNSADHISSFSNYGTGVDLVAPGEAIPMADLGASHYSEGYGTSFATAEVTGVASLLMARYPNMNYHSLAQTLIDTADTLDGNRSSLFYGAGRLNALKAVTFQPVVVSGSVTVTGTPKANGVDLATVSLVATANGQPQAGLRVRSTISGKDNILNGNRLLSDGELVDLGTTDQSGKVTFTLASTWYETKHLTFVSDAATTLNSQADIKFTAVSQPAYKSSWVSQSPYPTLGVGQTGTLTLTLKNTGQTAWLGNGAQADFGQLKIGTDRTRDRASAFYDATTWPSLNRVTVLTQPIVRPGETASFSFVIKAGSAGQYREYFRPVVEGVDWLNDLGIYWDVTVTGSGGTTVGPTTDPSSYAAQLLSSSPTTSLALGQTAQLSFSVKNIGTAIWQPITTGTTKGEVKLGATNPQDRTSQFKNSSWLSSNRVLGSDFAVSPGSHLDLSFSVTAPKVAGTYTEDFKLVSEGITWFGPLIRFVISVH